MPQSATSNENPQEFPQPRRGGERGRNRGRGRGSNRGFAQERRGRADFSHAGPNQDRSITTVVVENIPEDHFEEQKVREFFSSFGTIEEVHMQAYKRLALVKYQDWASAKRAYDSPKVIFDNRFVKVYWYKPSANPIEARAGNADARATSSDPPKSADEMQIDIDEIRKKQEELQKAHEEKMKKIKETEDSKRELEKRRGEFLKNQAELAARMAARNGDKAKPSPSPEVQGSLGGTNGVATPIPNGAQSQGSSKTEALKAQLAALEAEAQSLGIDSTMTDDAYGARGRGRGRGVYRGRGDFVPRGRGYDPNRGGYRGRGVPPYARGGRGGGVAYKLDNRPKRVTVSGVNFDEKKDEGLRQYLLGIGEFENIEPNPDRSDSQIITFKDRATAEKFAYGSAEIPSVGKLEIAWVSNPTTQTPTSTKPGIVAGAVSTDGDTSMQGDGSKEEIQRGLNEDYDVAEDDDRWMVE
ncbi:MAG: hypothetical protein M1833_004762 [Piccolia ochrophora]|nr:MAG: hypothetical protein M1833_004762 [Piccolia ochrophora]